MGRDAAAAVQHLHSLGFVHRDIKSHNFFVTDRHRGRTTMVWSDPSLRLGDFGETILEEFAAQERPQPIGTLAWMAPEIFENMKVGSSRFPQAEGTPYRASADVYSTTIVLWECLSGCYPYVPPPNDSTGNPLQGCFFFDQVVERGLRPCNGLVLDAEGEWVGDLLQTLIASGWHKDPSARPSAAELSSSFAKLIDEPGLTWV